MKITICLIFSILILSRDLIANDDIYLKKVCNDFNDLNTKVRDGLIIEEEAKRKFREILEEIHEIYIKSSKTENKNTKWVFPVEGYGKNSIGGTNGEGYIPTSYDYFDGNRHKGHPAHDIFIHDRDFNCLDDNTNERVNVLSASTGIVVSLEKSWKTTSNLRGGKYIWIFEPVQNQLFYYAHNDSILVNIGDIVESGITIAFVGRTGLNAYKKISPTHLHFMLLSIDDLYLPKPLNCYNLLLESLIR